MDSVGAHRYEAGWQELKTGGVSPTHTRVPRPRPDPGAIRAAAQRAGAALTDAETFGAHRGAEARRRDGGRASERVVIGDGAHGIGYSTETHGPQATPMVDGDPARPSMGNAATARAGEGRALHTPWARQHWDAVWIGTSIRSCG